MNYLVIYDGKCNLCANFTQLLSQVDQGKRFQYVPMQDEATLQRWGVTPDDCEQGMMLIQMDQPEHRWQGSDAAEEISRLLPGGAGLVQFYRALPGLKSLGDRAYVQIRDHRYDWFGERADTFRTEFEIGDCEEGTCSI